MKILEKKWMSLMKRPNQSLSSLIVIIIFFLVFLFVLKLQPDYISGKAKVVDGDTIKINGIKIRLSGIDAPELKQRCTWKNGEYYLCGEFSKSFLDFIEYEGVKIKCEYSNKDKYGRILGTCYKGKRDINSYMVEMGAAVAYKKYSKKYIAEEEFAKENKLGIWSGDFIRPEEWRKKNK